LPWISPFFTISFVAFDSPWVSAVLPDSTSPSGATEHWGGSFFVLVAAFLVTGHWLMKVVTDSKPSGSDEKEKKGLK
jgi:hypothetical protein